MMINAVVKSEILILRNRMEILPFLNSVIPPALLAIYHISDVAITFLI